MCPHTHSRKTIAKVSVVTCHVTEIENLCDGGIILETSSETVFLFCCIFPIGIYRAEWSAMSNPQQQLMGQHNIIQFNIGIVNYEIIQNVDKI